MTHPTSFFVTGGALSSDAPSYVARRADRELLEALRAGELCYVLTARQMGKSSLMVRAVSQLRAEGVDAAVVDLTAIGLQVTAEQWYRGLLTELGEQLGLEDALDARWQRHSELAPTQRWLRVLRDVFGSGLSRPVVIFIDEIDVVRSLPFRTDDFFAGLREIYNRRAREPALRLLTFCLLGVASPTDLIADPMLTPFNIGRRIELTDFTPSEASRLTEGIGRPPSIAAALLARVLFWTGAHPYLTQRLCQAIALDERAMNAAHVDGCCHELFLSPHARERDDNLIFVREHLLTQDGLRTALLDLLGSVLRGKAIVEDARLSPLVSSLHLSGIVRLERGRLQVRNRIYARVFDRAWVDRHLPAAELRRQRVAFRRGAVRASAISAVIVICVLGLSGLLFHQRNLLRVEQAHSRRLLYAAEINLAAQAWEGANADRTATLLGHHLPAQGQEDLRGFEWFYLWWLVHGDPRGIAGRVRIPTRLTYSSDGSQAAVAGWDGIADVWQVASRRVTATLASQDQSHVMDVVYSPDNRLLVTAGDDGTVRVWDPLTGVRLYDLKGHTSSVRGASFSPDGRLLATASFDRTVRIWDCSTRRAIAVLQGHTARVNVVRFSLDGTRIVSAGWDDTARLWDVRRARQVGVLRHKAEVEDVAFTRDGTQIVTAGWEAALSVWNARTLALTRRLEGHATLVTSISIAADSRIVASASVDGTVRLWDLDTGTERSRIRAAAGRHVRALSFAPDGRQLATVSDNGVVRFWDASSGEVHQESLTLRGQTKVGALDLSPDQTRMVTGSLHGTARIWQMSTGESLAVLPHAGAVDAVKYAPDGSLIVTQDRKSGALIVWNAGSGARVRVLQRDKPLGIPMFTPDGLHLVATAGGTRFVTWSTATWAVESDTDTGLILGAVTALSPDSTVLVTGNDSGVVRFWSREPVRLVAASTTHTDLVYAIVFSPDGSMMATGSFDGSVRLWDWRAGKELRTLKSHQGWVLSVAFSPDGRRIVTGGNDGTVKFWNVSDGQELVSFRRHTDLVGGLAFTRDGRILVSTGDLVKLWRAATPEEVASTPSDTNR